MSEEYKQRDGLPDLYKILGLTSEVCKESDCNEIIKKAYIKKAKICHPDKHPGRKDVAEIFELLTMAYDILKDSEERNKYNHKLSLHKQSSSDFPKLKKNTNNYMQSIGEYVPPSDQQKLSFKEQMNKLNLKHGFDPCQMDAIDANDFKKKVNGLTKERTQQDVEFKPDRLFDEGRFDLRKFNAAFDVAHERKEDSIVQHNGIPSAWNGLGDRVNFSSFDNLDNIYVEDNNRLDTSKQIYSAADFAISTKKLTKDDVAIMDGADYVDKHNVLDDDYYKNMKSELSSRKNQTSDFGKMAYGDYQRDNTAGYGIFDQLGFNFNDRLTLDNIDDNISERYEKLLSERKYSSNSSYQTQVPQNKEIR